MSISLQLIIEEVPVEATSSENRLASVDDVTMMTESHEIGNTSQHFEASHRDNSNQ